MCYDLAFLTKKAIKYAQRFGDTKMEIEELERQLQELEKRIQPIYHITGFDHPELPVITNRKPNKIQLFSWGLIPFWTKNADQALKMSNITINAKGEEMFDKPAFREPAAQRRCLVLVDGFYEHHFKDGLSYPYFIKLKNDEPFALAGLYDIWVDRSDGVVHETVSIVTTDANPMMAHIHNKPKGSKVPRMPLILLREFQKDWLKEIVDKLDRQTIQELIKPFDEELIESFTVPRLRGKAYLGNVPKIMERHRYAEMEAEQGSLF